jgi:hypothetical protein
MSLGQNQGYVDLTDIIAVVSDPEAEAERIEEIGWALHRAGIEIRDGDEVIDMEESEGEPEEQFAESAVGEAAPAPAPATSDAEPDLTPFSLEELGLSPEEIAALGLGDAAATAAPEPAPEPVAPATDGEPDLTPFSLEELGLSPEEIAALGLGAAAGAAGTAAAASEPPAPAKPASPPPPAPAPAAEEPELTPFSLADLGLTEEEIAQLNAAEAQQQTIITPATPQPAAEEPELTPFSLADLGLTEEEIAQLNAAEAGQAESSAADDLFDFGVADTTPVEKVTRRTEPRIEEPPPPVDTADAAFAAEPLDSLDDIWQASAPPPAPAPTAAAREEAARPVPPPVNERPAPREEPRPAPAPRPRDEGVSARTSTRSTTRTRDEDRFARREALTSRSANVSRPSMPSRSFADFVPSGDETLDGFLRELDAAPGNFGLSMAIGRLSAQTGRGDIMQMAYKGLIKAGYGLDEVADELEELVDALGDEATQRQLYRLLGDAYSKQGRFREAMAAYSYTFGR